MKFVKSIGITIFCLSILVLSGCVFKETIFTIRAEAEKVRKEISLQIIHFLNNEDSEGVKQLLCDKTKGIGNIDDQINASINFVEKIVSYETATSTSYEGTSKNDGIIDSFSIGWSIYNAKTASGETYELYIMLNFKILDENRKGITCFWIEKEEDDSNCQVGFPWKESYIYDANSLAQKVLEAINADDSNGLKEMFCKEISSKIAIDEKISLAFDFFDGKATFGEIAGKPGHFDGRQDFNSEVWDVVIIEDYAPTIIYLDVLTNNIITDSGKTYKLEWTAYILHEENPDYVGILSMTIIDGNEKCTIA